MAIRKLTYFKIVFPPLLQQFWRVWNDWTHMYKSLVFGDEFVAHLKSHQRCSAAFCRPVKFFHTDWIIISLWFLSYTQRHCHVRIEKSSVQTVAIQLEACNSLEQGSATFNVKRAILAPFLPIKFTWSHKIFDAQIKITPHIAKV